MDDFKKCQEDAGGAKKKGCGGRLRHLKREGKTPIPSAAYDLGGKVKGTKDSRRPRRLVEETRTRKERKKS